MSRVLLIGGNGFIVSHLADMFLNKGVEVRSLSFEAEKFRRPLKKVDYIYSDYGDIEILDKALQECDTVIHLAHNADPGSSITDSNDAINISNFINLLELIKSKNIRVILFSSGGVVYGNPEKNPVCEQTLLKPISPYGVTKVTMENYLYMYHHIYGIPYLIIRPSNAYGEREDFFQKQGVIPIFLKKILFDETIEIWGDGNVVRDYIYIKDLAYAVFLLYKKKELNGVFNIGSGRGTSINELVKIILSNFNESFEKIIYKKKRAFDVSKIVLDNSKLKNLTGWLPEVDLDSGIKLSLKWVKRQLVL